MKQRMDILLENKLLTTATCVAVGVAAGFAAEGVKKLLEKRNVPDKKDELLERMEDKIRSHEEHLTELSSEYKNLKDDIKVVGTDFYKPDISEIVDYTKFSHKGETVVAENGEPVDSEKQPDVNAPSVFEIISEEEFLRGTGNNDGYTSVAGTWWPDVKILTGWNEEEDEKDPRATIGEEALSMFDDESVKAIYVRNTHLKVLFEVVRARGNFGEEE